MSDFNIPYLWHVINSNETKYIINCVSVIPIDDLNNIFLNISASTRDTKLYSVI